jgi:alanine racemase|uniref:Alanine racemase n=1 Tax=candidate division WOR-3 bacterium TaxID=2052148 RepID=A0A7V3VU21_UNCW3
MYIFILMNTSIGRAWAEIYLDRLINNYKIIKEEVGDKKIMAAIKADAYGHGALEVAKALQKHGVDMFGVASVEEGIELRKGGIKKKIIILSPILNDQIDACIEFDLIPTISELSFFEKLNERLIKYKKGISVHIEVDTGMTRTGFPYDESISAIKKIQSSPFIKIEGIFSHFPLADTDGAFSKEQIERFKRLISNLNNAKVKPKFVHMANSSGIFRYPDSHFNLVRPGISLYGLSASPGLRYHPGFKPVMTLKSRIVNLREVPPGTPISYGHTYRTRRRSRIATVSVGYGDGYPRILSNNADVLCHGKRARIVGTICMDLMMIDVTHIPEARSGDVVTLIGEDRTEEIRVEELAEKSNTIVYEITSGIGPRVTRVFKDHNKIVGMRSLLERWNKIKGG